MHTRPASLLLITSATVLSYVSVLAGKAVFSIVSKALYKNSLAEARAWIPSATLFACDHLLLIVGSLTAACLAALAVLWRQPHLTGRCVCLGLCAQWLIAWGAAFCFCYDGFLSGWSMHHDPYFVVENFLSLAGGIFPASLVLILATVVLALWPQPTSERTLQEATPPNPWVEDLRRRLKENDFHAFTIVNADGTKHRVPSPAHLSIAPRGTRMAVWSERGVSSMVNTSSIAGIEDETLS